MHFAHTDTHVGAGQEVVAAPTEDTPTSETEATPTPPETSESPSGSSGVGPAPVMLIEDPSSAQVIEMKPPSPAG